ncbi:MAG: hypothetical protein LBD48_07315 [Treponema sp.]|nr:hypothetical protein [Treponema sp.]
MACFGTLTREALNNSTGNYSALCIMDFLQGNGCLLFFPITALIQNQAQMNQRGKVFAV